MSDDRQGSLVARYYYAGLWDALFVRRLRNEARASMRDTSRIGIIRHMRWYMAKLREDWRSVIIMRVGGVRVGVLRLDLLDRISRDAVEVGLVIAPKWRGCGLGERALVHARVLAAHVFGATTVVAEIREENMASRCAFHKAGFEADEEQPSDGFVVMRALAARRP